MKKIATLISCSALLATACATMPYEPYAREVKKKPREGGVIALRSVHRPEDRARADFLMAGNCGSDAVVKVSEEGEVVVGEKTNSSSNRRREEEMGSGFRIGGIAFASAVPGENTNTQSETTQVKEWQISYECSPIEQPGRGKRPGRR